MSDTVNRFPPGWDEARVRDLIEHSESQTEDEAVAEDEAAFEDKSQTVMLIPNELVPAVRPSQTPPPTPGSTGSRSRPPGRRSDRPR